MHICEILPAIHRDDPTISSFPAARGVLNVRSAAATVHPPVETWARVRAPDIDYQLLLPNPESEVAQAFQVELCTWEEKGRYDDLLCASV